MKPRALLLVLLLTVPVAAQDDPPAARLVGGRSTYVVRAGDTLASIGARFGVAPAALIDDNLLARPDELAVGQTLTLDNSHIAVIDAAATVTINIAQRMLFVADGAQVTAYPIAAGKRTWPTPLGPFTVVGKEVNPVWDVPVSIQREMAAQGKAVVTRMAPSPLNPLGAHWIGLSLPGLGIHGTNAPSSIYRLVSHGCIRMHPDDVADLFGRVSVGTAGVLVYQPVIVAVIDGRVWLEVHRDEYRRAPDAPRQVRDLSERYGVGAGIDWNAVDEAVRRRDGRAVDVTKPR